METMLMRWAATLVAGLGLVACAGGPPGPGGGRIAVDVAALSLTGVDNVTYTLTVKNEAGELVWSRQLDADGYGDGVGSLSYVGPCDADEDTNSDGAATNSVALVLDAVVAGGVTLSAGVDYLNPAPGPTGVTRSAVCAPNADTAVRFDLTLARRATQGFFDVAVTFEDVFCSAKVDCVDGEGAPLELLHQPGGGRGRTVVAAFACTGGPGSDSWLYASPAVIDCGAAGAVSLAPVEPAGNQGAIAPWVFEHALYFGAEQLADGAGSLGKVYWNLAVGLDEAALPVANACTLSWHATAASARFDAGAAPAGTTWPQVDWVVELKAAGATALTCTRHPLYGDASGVAVSYAQDITWPYEMYGDALGGGSAAFARTSGGNGFAPVWAGAADLGTLAYDGALDVTLAAPDADPGAVVTYTSADLPAWLTLNATTGQLTGATLDEGELGALSFTVVASDGLHAVPRTFTLLARWAPHCEAIRQAQPSLSGLSLHTIDPAGAGTGTFEALCDMTTFGGGWTLASAQFEVDPAPWAEGRQADYDPSLATTKGFALAAADLVGDTQLAWGRVQSTGVGTWDAAMIDYANLAYDPAGTYAEVTLQGLATPRTFHIDRHTAGLHGSHNPEQPYIGVVSTDAAWGWRDVLTIAQTRGRIFTWAFGPNFPDQSYRGHSFGGVVSLYTESYAWALWVRPGAAHTPSPAALPVSCKALKQANPSLSGVGLYDIQPPGADPLQVLCDMTQWGGGWTLVVAQYEETPVTNWAEGRIASAYTPSLWSAGIRQSFTLAAPDVPAHTQTAFGTAWTVPPGAWTTQWIDYVNFVYNPAVNIPKTLLTGLGTADSYHIHRSTTVFYGDHDPESNTGTEAMWMRTLTFDRTGGVRRTWAFAPLATPLAYRGYAFAGANSYLTADSLFWAVWVR